MQGVQSPNAKASASPDLKLILRILRFVFITMAFRLFVF